MALNKLHNKDFTIAVKTGGNAHDQVKFAKEASKGELFYNTFDNKLYIATTDAGAVDAILYNTDSFTLTPAPFTNGFSLEFDGTNDDMSPNTAISISGAKTVTFWCYPHNFNNRCILAGGGGASYWFFWGSSTAAYIVSPSTPVKSGGSNVSWSANQWYHVAIVDDGAGTVTPYINGAPQDPMSISGKSFAISKIANLTSHFYDGILDEMGFWNSALGSAEIAEIYGSLGNREFDLTADSGNYSSSSSLQHYYRMGDNDSGSNSIVTDKAGSNDLLINGATPSNTVPF